MGELKLALKEYLTGLQYENGQSLCQEMMPMGKIQNKSGFGFISRGREGENNEALSVTYIITACIIRCCQQN